MDFAINVDSVMPLAVQALSTSGLLPFTRGLTEVEAMAQVAALALKLLPEDPYAISGIVVRHGLLPATVPERHSFCPMLVATEWDTQQGGISSFNMHFAQGLADALRPGGTPVYVLVLSTEMPSAQELAEWKSAESCGIYVADASLYRGEYTPRISSAARASVTHIIGHAHITGEQAVQIQSTHEHRHARIWQINHVLPREVDLPKEGRAPQARAESARRKEEGLCRLNDRADRVFSVGRDMYDHFQHRLASRPGRHEQLILPLNPFFVQGCIEKVNFGQQVAVLYFGRVEEVFSLKGVDIAVKACAKARQQDCFTSTQRRLTLTIVGVPPNKEVEGYAEHRECLVRSHAILVRPSNASLRRRRCSSTCKGPTLSSCRRAWSPLDWLPWKPSPAVCPSW